MGTARAGTIIERFGGYYALDLLGPENIHNPLNAMAPLPLEYQLLGELGIRLMAARGGSGFASLCHRLTAITRL